MIVLALLIAVGLAAGGCGSAKPDGILGLVVIHDLTARSSASPLPGEFGQSDGQFTPDPHALILVKSQATSQVLRRVRADSQGVFQLDLPPGEYFVQSAHLPKSFGVQVTVLEGTGYYRIMVDTAERN